MRQERPVGLLQLEQGSVGAVNLLPVEHVETTVEVHVGPGNAGGVIHIGGDVLIAAIDGNEHLTGARLVSPEVSGKARQRIGIEPPHLPAPRDNSILVCHHHGGVAVDGAPLTGHGRHELTVLVVLGMSRIKIF